MDKQKIEDVVYLCDGLCEECKGSPECHLNGGPCKQTYDIKHARNFVNVGDNKYMESEITETKAMNKEFKQTTLDLIDSTIEEYKHDRIKNHILWD